ncbi:MAG: alpha-L-arabinofuranosidase [Chloroflexi bacterium]|nr:alpha-L-arabinofuranosidase [Chloroflexota bacterium]
MIRWFTFLCGVLALALPARHAPALMGAVPQMPNADLNVYADALAGGWDAGWSWDSTINLDNTAPARGTRSIAVTYSAGWAGLSLWSPNAIDAGLYSAVTLWVHGGAAGTRNLNLHTQPADDGAASAQVPFTAQAGAWKQITVTMSQLGSPAQIKRINVQNNSASAQAVFYVDDIRLVGAVASSPSSPTATVRIQAGGAITPVDVRLLGSNLAAWTGPANFASATYRTRLAASGVSVLRMPGGSWSNSYGWLSCEQRANQPGALPCDGDSDWKSWVARPTDFIDLLQAVSKPGMWVVSLNGTSREAAAAVAFFNARITDTTTIGTDIKGTNWYTAGHWAQLRAAHGNPDPLGIELWGVGNELFAPSQCGGWEPAWTCEGTEYANGVGAGAARHEGFIEFRTAMRAVDPAIQVGAVGVTDQGAWGNWGNEVIAAAGQAMDFYDVHQYAYWMPPAGGTADVLAQPQGAWAGLKANITAAFDAHAGGRHIPIGVTEHNLFSVWNNDADLWMARAVDGLFVADSIGQMARHGFALANQWMVDHSHYGLLNDSAWRRSPQYFAFVLWSKFGQQMVPVTSTASAATTLSVYAGRVNSSTLSLLAINKSASPITATIDVAGFAPLIGGMADVAGATTLSDMVMRYNGVSESALSNDLSNAPSSPFSASGSRATYTFAPYSLTLLRLRAAPPNVSPRAFVPVIAE